MKAKKSPVSPTIPRRTCSVERGKRERSGQASPKSRGRAHGFDQLEFELMHILFEERAMRIDLLAQLVRRKVATVQARIDRLVERGLVESDYVLKKEEYPWAWLTEEANTKVFDMGRNCYRRVSLSQVTHMFGIANVRLLCARERPELLWVSERTMKFQKIKGDGTHPADGALEGADGSLIGIEVELTGKDRGEVERIMLGVVELFGKGEYYCSPFTLGSVTAARGSLGLEDKVEIYRAPGEILWVSGGTWEGHKLD